MKIVRPAILPAKAIKPILARFALGAAIIFVAAACTAPESPRRSAVPPTYSQATYHRPAGVLNTPYNTGNPPEDLDPHTVHWGDVRPNY